MSSTSTYTRVLAATVVGVFLLAACETGTEPVASQITIYGGDNQVGSAGSMLTLPLAVRVTDSRNRPVPDVRIRWAVEEGGGFLSATTTPSVTDAGGIARVYRTLGGHAGAHTASASMDGRATAPGRLLLLDNLGDPA